MISRCSLNVKCFRLCKLFNTSDYMCIKILIQSNQFYQYIALLATRTYLIIFVVLSYRRFQFDWIAGLICTVQCSNRWMLLVVMIVQICCPAADVDPPVLMIMLSLFGLQNCCGDDEWLEGFEPEEFSMNGFTLSLLLLLFCALCWLTLALTALFSSSLLKWSSEWQSTARSFVSSL